MKIQTKKLRKSFGRKSVLRDVNLELSPGEVICITGPNGSGKSTLIKILSTLLRPDRGEFLINGKEAFKNPRILRKQMGVLLHKPMLYEQLTARENLKYVSRIYRIEGDNRKVGLWLERVGLTHFADERIEDFSEGMRQRLAIARAMMHTSELLLLDEPFSSLDQAGIEMMTELVEEHLSRGSSAVITSHMSRLLERLSSHVLCISEGRLR